MKRIKKGENKMSNLEKYVNSFVEGLGVEAVIVNSELVYQSITEWDSV